MSRIKRKTLLRLLRESSEIFMDEILVPGVLGDHSPPALRINDLTYEIDRVLRRAGVTLTTASARHQAPDRKEINEDLQPVTR